MPSSRWCDRFPWVRWSRIRRTFIHYEVFRSGHPFLLLAPGGVNSQIDFWEHSAINAIKEFSDDFMVIGMDQRYAGKSQAPLTSFSYEQALGDQLAVFDELGVTSAHVMVGCIGCAYALNLLDQAPARISAAVLQDPVGLDESNSMDTFYDMFNDTIRVTRADGLDAVIAAAMEQPLFMMNNAGGPWAQRLHDDEVFQGALLSLRREAYIALVIDFRDGIWPPTPPYFTVNEVAVQRCLSPDRDRSQDLCRRAECRLPRRRCAIDGEAAGDDRDDSRVPARKRTRGRSVAAGGELRERRVRQAS